MSTSSSHPPPRSIPPVANADDYMIPENSIWAKSVKISALVGLLGIVGAVAGYASDPRRFAFSWLFAFAVFFTIAMGAMFFVVCQHLVGASWSVTVRRTAEFFMMGIIALVALFVPVGLSIHQLYGEWTLHGHHEEGEAGEHGEHSSLNPIAPSVAKAQDQDGHEHGAEGHAHGDGGGHAIADEHHTPQHTLHSEILDHKMPYLNVVGWFGRAAGYFAIWLLIAFFYFRRSTRQDESRALGETVAMQKWSPLSMLAFGLSMTFAAFDWLMALEAAWYSTIFGVCLFAGAVVAIHALISLITLGLRKHELLGDAVNVEHFHDLGKLTFGFVVFWAYVSFSQMMLIWYAGIPEEAVYYHLRWGDENSWTAVSAFLIIGHFVVPFFFLISRNVKRRLGLYGFGVAWLLFMHVVDMYWYVMPHFEKGVFAGHWMDAACLAAVGGVYLATVFYFMNKYPLIPVGDPRLSRSLKFQNA